MRAGARSQALDWFRGNVRFVETTGYGDERMQPKGRISDSGNRGCCIANGTGHQEAGVRIANGDPHPPSLTRRSFNVATKMAPIAVLAVLPKCPMCLAAYVALGTGIGISLAAATYTRFLLIALCVTSLIYFILNAVRRRRNWMGHTPRLGRHQRPIQPIRVNK
jgi:hypothetical protein